MKLNASILRMSLIKTSLLFRIVSAAVVLVFSYTAANKIVDWQQFKVALNKSPYLHDWVTILQILIPLSELGIVLLILVPRTMLFGMYAAFFLMAVFSCYVFVMLRYSYFLPCSCGGIISAMNWNQHLAFNLVMTIMIAAAIFQIEKTMTNSRYAAEHL